MTERIVLDEYDTVGELGIRSGHPRWADAIAKTDVCVDSVPQSEFERLLRENRPLQRDIKALAESRLNHAALTSGGEFDESRDAA